MTQQLVIIGCGGFGREVYSIVQELRAAGADWSVEAFVDDAPSEENLARVKELGSLVLGPISVLAHQSPRNGVIAVGSPQARSGISELLSRVPIEWPSLVHPHGSVGLEVELGPGSVVAAGARLSTNIRLGRYVHVDQNVTVGHDTSIGDFTRINPQACVSGSVAIGERVLIGANATVLPGRRIGSGAVVGAGAVVISDVDEGATVKGVPAR